MSYGSDISLDHFSFLCYFTDIAGMVQDASEGRKIATTSKMADAGTFGLTCQKAGQPSDGSRPCKTWLAELPKLSPMPNAAIDGMAKAGQVTLRDASGNMVNGMGIWVGKDTCPTAIIPLRIILWGIK